MSVEISENAKAMLARLNESNVVYQDFDMPEGDDADALNELVKSGFCSSTEDGREGEYQVYAITSEGKDFLG